MPRKPKIKKRIINVPVRGTLVKVVLHPPTDARKSWYAYWNGLVTSKSTGQAEFAEAARVAEEMLREQAEGGSVRRPRLADAVLSDEEFEAVQRAHFGRKTDPRAKARSEKSLKDTLEAVAAFRAISG